ncbi:MAG TPA: universal stress protein [Verrucomicrobiota bacterium]|nr:universal stress protein [Verrucomicrobiota bacterium]
MANLQPATDCLETRFKRILFCTDFSESADAAFEFALDAVVRRPGSKLYILHVVPEVQAQFWKSYIYEVDNIDAEAKRLIDQKVAEGYLPRIPAGVDVEAVYRVGPEAQCILDFAAETKIDLIVLGRHGKSGVHKALFGSVAEKIVRKARCAVLIIPVEYVKG